MSINHIIRSSVADTEKLDVKFKDVYCDNVYESNPLAHNSKYTRQYQQLGVTSAISDTETQILNPLGGSIGDYLLAEYNVGTRHEFYSQGDYTATGTSDLSIFIRIGPVLVFATQVPVPYTVGGHSLSGYLQNIQTGVAGVAKLSGGVTLTFDSGSSSITRNFSFTNDTTYQTENAEYLNITAKWSTATGNGVEYRDFKLDRVG